MVLVWCLCGARIAPTVQERRSVVKGRGGGGARGGGGVGGGGGGGGIGGKREVASGSGSLLGVWGRCK